MNYKYIVNFLLKMAIHQMGIMFHVHIWWQHENIFKLTRVITNLTMMCKRIVYPRIIVVGLTNKKQEIKTTWIIKFCMIYAWFSINLFIMHMYLVGTLQKHNEAKTHNLLNIEFYFFHLFYIYYMKRWTLEKYSVRK